jgi:tRNA(fMet)-specific endonuclease VapC
MYLLDTCTISEVVNKQLHPNVLNWFSHQPPEDVYISVITIGEITRGIQKMPISRRRTELEAWLAQDILVQFRQRIVGIDLNTMILWGELTGRLEPQGRMLPTMDSLIASLALQNSLALVTRNEKDFAGTGVTIFNPWN